MRLAIVGLPLSGKTTLFRALTGLEAAAGTSSEGGVHLGVFRVPDPRLDRLAEALPHPVVTHTSVEIADIPGFSTAGSRGLDEKAMGAARAADALVLVVRSFNRPSVPHSAGKVDTAADLEAMWTDMTIADLSSAEKRIEKLKSLISKSGASKEEVVEAWALERTITALESGEGAGSVKCSGEEERLLRGFGFLTAKPLVLVVNLGEEELPPRITPEWDQWGKKRNAIVLVLCADLLLELGRLTEEEGAEFAREYGVNPDEAISVIEAAYRALDVVTFYTATGEKELRAWTLRRGRSAVEAAGEIHSDMARGFIRAEVIGVDELVGVGSWSDARKAGLVRQEGKSYCVADGDVLNIKFAL